MMIKRYTLLFATLVMSPLLYANEPIATGKMLGDTCAACHGTFGKSYNEYMPQLAGIGRERFIRAMHDYRADKRVSVVMNNVAKGYNDAEISAMADYFAQMK